ncbi:unnamed protein product [Kluyveromyces dobzhanskii CBS 2104]|uniref:NADPH:adrenodoxin oxidoreductase, mitochondrial n=1 Tax=Kluyveromyces dobzhanskii CBS 2104 TaxID=1427455 RepID=A0A0A8L1M7_9SACH|nr:unnamed protein product [Kluyveromyces dobzhanskii CBS 2104]
MVPKSISIIGSGPSGFYTAHHLLQQANIPLDVTIWERLPVPFGLSRYGVAPDHPNVKNCEDTFTKTVEDVKGKHSMHKFNFIGNCEVGKDIELSKLLSKQDAVVLSYGCTTDKRLGIPGENDTNGVFTSRQFVNWYNGHPDFALNPKFMDFDWKSIKNVGIIGNGNVALDLARLLLSSTVNSIWGHTDVNPYALNKIKEAPIENVKLIARRDFPNSKFTNKELREMWLLEEHGVKGHINSEYFTPEEWDMKEQVRSFRRCVDLCSEYVKPFEERSAKYQKLPQPTNGVFQKHWELDYLKTPLEIVKDETKGLLKSLKLCNNTMTKSGKVIPHLDSTVSYDFDLLITSLGYKGSPLPGFEELGVQFDGTKIVNNQGRVVDFEGNKIPGLYTSGWIGKGASGVILSTMSNAFKVADNILDDLEFLPTKQDTSLPSLHNVNYTTWEEAQTILKFEEQKGQEESRPREKLLTIKEMLQVVKK